MKRNEFVGTIGLMTLVVALKSKAGVVLAGDRRNYEPRTATYDDNAVKVFRVNDKAAIAAAGDGFDCKEVINEVMASPKISSMSLEEIKDLMFEKARSKQAEMVGKSESNPLLIAIGAVSRPQFGFILAGLGENEEPTIYSLSDSNIVPRLITDNHCQLGAVDVSKYIFMNEYKSGMSVEELAQLATKSIKETAKISAAVSEDLDLIKIKTK